MFPAVANPEAQADMKAMLPSSTVARATGVQWHAASKHEFAIDQCVVPVSSPSSQE